MGQAESLLQQLDAELAHLNLPDRDLVLRLRESVSSVLAAEGLDQAPESGTVSAEVGGRVALAVLEEIATMLDIPDELAVQRQELVEVDARLRALRKDPRNVENLDARELVRRVVRRRRR